MVENGFNKLFWGFFFTMIDLRIQGFDILPDIIGYILFAIGLSILAAYSENFKNASKYNIPMIIFSALSIYEKQGGGIQFGLFGPFGILVAIASFVLSLLVIYYMFNGIKDMAEKQAQPDIYDEADKRWTQYLILQIAVLLSFFFIFVPALGFIYIIAIIIASIIMSIVIMKFMRTCGESLKD